MGENVCKWTDRVAPNSYARSEVENALLPNIYIGYSRKVATVSWVNTSTSHRMEYAWCSSYFMQGAGPSNQNGGDWFTVFGTQRRRPDTGVASDGSDRTQRMCWDRARTRSTRQPRHFATVAHVTRPGIVEEGPFCGPRANPIDLLRRPPTPVEALVHNKFPPGTCSSNCLPTFV
jgi:hypothetical protein